MSVGDNMTFFYRRLPPLSRRKNGVLVVVDESAAKYCKDGDIAHNRYICQLFAREAKISPIHLSLMF